MGTQDQRGSLVTALGQRCPRLQLLQADHTYSTRRHAQLPGGRGGGILCSLLPRTPHILVSEGVGRGRQLPHYLLVEGQRNPEALSFLHFPGSAHTQAFVPRHSCLTIFSPRSGTSVEGVSGGGW